MPATGTLARKLDTLGRLASGLDERHTVYHGVHWTRVDGDQMLFGEIDFIVVGPSGRLLLIEQKPGLLDETTEGLMQRSMRAVRRVGAQLAHNADQLRARLERDLSGSRVRIESLLYCPDYTVREPATAGIDPARIVDATQRDALVVKVRELVREDPDEPPAPPALHRFLADALDLVPDVNALVGQVETLYTRLSGGLAEWARRIEMNPFRLRVTATAGSGKTQLAVAVFRDAIAAGRRPLYVCFNRPLADHVARIVPPGGEVASYHQLCDRMLRAQGQVPDFSREDAFGRMEEAFGALTTDPDGRFDELIVDEGQDFLAPWHDRLLALLKPGGRAWWIEDPLQNLYERPEIALHGWVRLRSDRNYRSPADIVEALARMLPLDDPPQAGSPLTGSGLEIGIWRDEADLLDKTRRAITRALGLGFRRERIALITWRGRERSVFTGQERLGAHALKRFTGRYDLLGAPVYTEGDLLLESVYRFKGQAAPCVIFTEVDFETLDPRAVRKLFVGATRASLKLLLLLSQRAAERLGASTESP